MKKTMLILTCMVLLAIPMTSCTDEAEIICMDKVWYRDKDGDSRGDPNYYLYSCKVQPEGFVDNPDVTDDNDPNK